MAISGAGDVLKTRPAESTAVAASLALLIARAAGVDDTETITAIAIVIGFIPTIVTTIIEMVRRSKGQEPPRTTEAKI